MSTGIAIAQTQTPSPSAAVARSDAATSDLAAPSPTTSPKRADDREGKQQVVDEQKKNRAKARSAIVARVWKSIAEFHAKHPYVATLLDIFVVFPLVIGILGNVLPLLGNYTWYLVVTFTVLVWTWLLGDMDYFWVFTLGMATAFTEIIGKFRDEPLESVKTGHAVVYHIFNGVIAVFALYLLHLFTEPSTEPGDNVKKILVAGLGAMLVMRSKLFNIKVGGEDVSFGPEQIVKIFLSFMEEAIDRIRARDRIEFLKKYVEALRFDRFDNIADFLTAMLRSAQTRTMEQKAAFETKIKDISSQNGPKGNRNKCYALGFELLNAMGEDFALEVFQNMPSEVRDVAPTTPQATGLIDKLNLFKSSTSEDTQFYMAYGTDMSGARFRQRLKWSEEEFRKLPASKKSVLSNYRVVFNQPIAGTREGNVNIVPDENEKVEGVLYTLLKSQVEFLDTQAPGYDRKTVSVEADGKTVDAEVYLAQEIDDSLRPNAIAVSDVIKGAEEHGLSESYVQKLRTFAGVTGSK